MKSYVTSQMLSCIKKNQIFPQTIQITNNQYVVFGSVGMKLLKYTKCGIKTKHINRYRGMKVEEINRKLNEMDWVQYV